MGLKSTELTRAEYLTEEQRQKLGIDEGLVVVEIRNKNLRQEEKPAKEGYTAYLRSLGEYKEDDGSWATD